MLAPVKVPYDLVSKLQNLGFAEYEARSYIGLLAIAPATAYEISKQTGVPRANTYNALENRVKKGAVQPVGERPARYAPLPPKDLLRNIAEGTRQRCAELATGLLNISFGSEPQFVWTVIGERKVHSKIGDLMRSARRHIWIKASEEILDQHLAELRTAYRRGLEIIIILFGQNPERFALGNRARVYLHEGNGVRIGGADNLFTLTIDYSEALTAHVRDDYVGAYTQSSPMVTMAETIIRHDVYLAEIFDRFGDEIARAFGPHLIELRRRLFSADQLDTFHANLRQLGIVDDADQLLPGGT